MLAIGVSVEHIFLAQKVLVVVIGVLVAGVVEGFVRGLEAVVPVVGLLLARTEAQDRPHLEDIRQGREQV